jgi:hypothetical protein
MYFTLLVKLLCIFGIFVGHACNNLNIKHIEVQNFQCLGLCWMVDVFHAKCGFWIILVLV